MSRYWPLVCLALMHAVVDTYAMLPEPLWPLFGGELGLSPEQLELVLNVSMLTLNFSQPAFGYLLDRFGARSVLWAGPLVGVVCLSLIGSTASLLLLNVVLFFGMAGIGAFHPAAAVRSATLLPEERTRGISLFMFGGTLGLAIGPMLSGYLASRFGLGSLAILAIPGAVLVLLLQMATRTANVSAPQPHTHAPAARLNAHQLKLALFLLLVCTLRVLPNVGMTKAIAFTLSANGGDAALIGRTQSVFLVSGSLGLLLMATRFPVGWERASLIWCPLVGIPLLWQIGTATSSYRGTLVLLALAGALFNGTTPAMVAYAHQLFPRGAGFASALTMGFSWGLAGLIVAKLTTVCNQAGHPEWLYFAFVPGLLVAALGAAFLPRSDEAADRHADLTPAVPQGADAS